jgi:hypothetical protein
MSLSHLDISFFLTGQEYHFEHIDVGIFFALTFRNRDAICAHPVLSLKTEEEFAKLLHALRNGDISSPNNSLSSFILFATACNNLRFRSQLSRLVFSDENNLTTLKRRVRGSQTLLTKVTPSVCSWCLSSISSIIIQEKFTWRCLVETNLQSSWVQESFDRHWNLYHHIVEATKLPLRTLDSDLCSSAPFEE